MHSLEPGLSVSLWVLLFLCCQQGYTITAGPFISGYQRCRLPLPSVMPTAVTVPEGSRDISSSGSEFPTVYRSQLSFGVIICIP